jgi:hypothetical protein
VDKVRKRKLDARVNRQASYDARYGTSISVPQPKDFLRKGVIKVGGGHGPSSLSNPPASMDSQGQRGATGRDKER